MIKQYFHLMRALFNKFLSHHCSIQSNENVVSVERYHLHMQNLFSWFRFFALSILFKKICNFALFAGSYKACVHCRFHIIEIDNCSSLLNFRLLSAEGSAFKKNDSRFSTKFRPSCNFYFTIQGGYGQVL